MQYIQELNQQPFGVHESAMALRKRSTPLDQTGSHSDYVSYYDIWSHDWGSLRKINQIKWTQEVLEELLVVIWAPQIRQGGLYFSYLCILRYYVPFFRSSSVVALLNGLQRVPNSLGSNPSIPTNFNFIFNSNLLKLAPFGLYWQTYLDCFKPSSIPNALSLIIQCPPRDYYAYLSYA